MICYEVAFRMYDFVLTHGQRVRVLVNELYLIYTRRFIVYLLLLFSFDSSSFAVLGQYSTRDSRNTANWHTATRKTIKSSVVVCLWIFWSYQTIEYKLHFRSTHNIKTKRRKKNSVPFVIFFFSLVQLQFRLQYTILHGHPFKTNSFCTKWHRLLH